MVITPASFINFATSADRRRFSERSSAVNPRSRFSPCRMFWPYSTVTARPSSHRRRLQRVGDPALAAAGQADQQHRHRHLAVALLALGRRDQALAQLEARRRLRRPDVARRPAAAGLQDHAGADRVVRQPVDEDERPGRGVGAVRVARQRLRQAELHVPDLVQPQPRDRPGAPGC